MERCKQIVTKICVLPTLPTFLIAIPSFALVIYALVNPQSPPLLQYVSYFLSAYALTITVTWTIRLVILLRSDKENLPLLRWANENPIASRLLSDKAYRTRATLMMGLAINLAYVAIKLTMGVIAQSLWFLFIGVYYLMLVAMRLSLLRHIAAQDETPSRAQELRLARRCGILLLVMNQALIFIVALVVHQNRGYEYPGLMIYAMAAYSFYAIIAAAINLTKQVKKSDPILSVIRVIGLTTAMVSIFSLETAMLTQFGKADEPFFRQIMTGCTGAVICLCVLLMAIVMIVRATKALNQIEIDIVEGNDPA